MSLGGNGRAWAVIAGVIAVGLCAGLGTAGLLVSALDLPEMDFDAPPPAPEVSAPVIAEPPVVPPVAEQPVQAALTLAKDATQDARLGVLASAFNQGTLESRETLDAALQVFCESGLEWSCNSPQHLGEVDRDLLDQGCAADEAVSCVVLGWQLTQRDERGLPSPGRANMQWMGVGTDLVDTTRDLTGADAFEQACRLGEPRGCGELGRAYGWGVGRAYAPSDAMVLFDLACEAGEVRSCSWLGDAYEAKDEIERAKALYKQVCDSGVGEGCRAAAGYEEDAETEAALLVRGCDVLQDGRACVWQAQNLANGDDLAGVTRLLVYCELPNLGLPYACDAAAGFFLNEGNPVPMDQERAAGLNRAACEGGDAGGCSHLAFRYQDGRGVQIDVAQAETLLDRACGENRGEACRELAEIRFNAAELQPSKSRLALAAMERACELEDGEGCNRLGIVLSQGEGGVAKDTPRVESLYRQACENDFAWGCYNEAWWADAGAAGEAPWAAQKLKLSCEMGLAQGCDAYAERLLTGRGVAYDTTAGAEYKLQACELGMEEACTG
ncbi:MAG: TPR repeat protein [Cognaticolwellia sp.]|jgi:TPR repeat protein